MIFARPPLMYNESMNRYLAFAGAVALALSQPAILLAEPAPPGAIAMPMPAAAFHPVAMPVYRPAPRPAMPARPIMAHPDVFKVPTDFKPLRATIAQPALQPNPLLLPNRLHYWPGFFWPTNFVYPGSCFAAANGSWGPWGMLATPNFSLTSNAYAAAQQIDPQYGVDIGTLGGVYQGYAPAQSFCGGAVGF